MQAASVVYEFGQHQAALIDVEQANAIELLMSRSLWREYPIFTYVEYMVRCAETLFDDGDLGLALAIAERTNMRLKDYAAFHSMPYIPRPQSLDPILVDILSSGLVLAFIAGHEFGHALQSAQRADTVLLFKWLELRYQENEYEQGRSTPGSYHRFLKPETTQKFDTRGLHDGDVVQSMKLMKHWHVLRQSQIEEVQADALGLIAASLVAARAGIPPRFVFGIVLGLLEDADRLVMLRRILPRLPRGTKRCSIPLEHSALLSRQCLYVRLVRALREGSVPAPLEVLNYWAALPSAELEFFENSIETGRLEQLAHRTVILIRGALHTAFSGSLPPRPSESEIKASWGPLAPTGYFLSAHLDIGSEFFRIEETFEWKPEENLDGSAAGFGAAIRDIAEVTVREDHSFSTLRREDILRNGKDDDFIEVLRSARTQVVRRAINTNWDAGFKYLLSRDK